MNECVICSKECGKGKTCGDTCRQALSRRNKCDKGVSVTADNVTVGIPRTPAAQADFDLHEEWRSGEGTVYQQRLGQLAYNYRPDYTKEKYYEPGSCKICGCELPLPLTCCHPCVDAKYESIASPSVA